MPCRRSVSAAPAPVARWSSAAKPPLTIVSGRVSMPMSGWTSRSSRRPLPTPISPSAALPNTIARRCWPRISASYGTGPSCTSPTTSRARRTSSSPNAKQPSPTAPTAARSAVTSSRYNRPLIHPAERGRTARGDYSMFENLTARLGRTLKNLRGQGRLTEDNIKEALRDVRMALLEADVALPVVREFIEHVRERAVGKDVLESLTPGHAMLGRFLKERRKKSVMVASCDVYRPAAIEQLQTLAQEVGAVFFPSTAEQDPVAIAQAAVEAARKQFIDVLLIDTAGRLHIVAEMMDEIKRLHTALRPIETLFVVDSMTGQDAANTAKAFNDALPLSGVVLTKTDGDARGGAA